MRQTRWVSTCLGMLLLLGCGRDKAVDEGRPRQLKLTEMSHAERLYGMAPTPDPAVTYQPDVLIVGGGAAAIRSRRADGLTWTIDANAPHALELVQGRIFFMTNRAVGRVLDVKRSGGDLNVTIGPVDITDVLQTADLHIKDMPLDLDQAIASSLTNTPGQIATLFDPKPSGELHFMKTEGLNLPAPLPPATPNDVSKILDKDFKFMPSASRQGIGVGVTAEGGDLKFGVETECICSQAYGNYTFKGGFRAGTLGLSSLNVANRITLIVGIGDHGFAAGPYASFLSAVAVVKMSDIATQHQLPDRRWRRQGLWS